MNTGPGSKSFRVGRFRFAEECANRARRRASGRSELHAIEIELQNIADGADQAVLPAGAFEQDMAATEQAGKYEAME